MECHNTVHYFDGKTPHATMPFQGQRFTLVFYTRREVPSAKPGVRATLTELGFPLPPTGEWLTDTTTPEAVVKDVDSDFITAIGGSAGACSVVGLATVFEEDFKSELTVADD